MISGRTLDSCRCEGSAHLPPDQTRASGSGQRYTQLDDSCLSWLEECEKCAGFQGSEAKICMCLLHILVVLLIDSLIYSFGEHSRRQLKMGRGEITPVRIPIHVIIFRCQMYLVTTDFNFFCCSDIYGLLSVRYLILLMWTFLKGGHERSVVSDFAFFMKWPVSHCR